LPTPEPAIEIGYRTDNVRSVMLESSAERVKVQTWFSDLPLPKPVQRPAMRTALPVGAGALLVVTDCGTDGVVESCPGA
jgi:hypothetical protein